MNGQGRLILYDTCNFRDYPVGGQLTSIRNFLRFLSEEYPEKIGEVLLVGVSCDEGEVGREQRIHIEGEGLGKGGEFRFLAVTQAATDQGHVKKSLRLEYLKGLFKYRRFLGLKKGDCNYIHTPEAFAAIRLLRPGAACYVFSHGTYLDMWRRVRFFKKAPLVRRLFQGFLMHVIRRSTAVFVLEKKTLEDYGAYNARVYQVKNSIVCHPFFERSLQEDCGRFLYAGRLSAVKNVGPLIEAVKGYHRNCCLTILGDGEEREMLERLAGGSDRIRFIGAVGPEEVSEEMQRADILLMNSVFEGIPMTILESISYGLPVITTDVGGIGEALTYGLDSEVTDGSVERIQEAMDRIGKEYGRYVRNAHEKSSQFDYSRVNRTVFSVLNETLCWEERPSEAKSGEA